MTSESTTIRVSVEQRERLRSLAAGRGSTMTDTLDAALDALRRQQFYEQMAEAEATLRQDEQAWNDYVLERDAWLNPMLDSA